MKKFLLCIYILSAFAFLRAEVILPKIFSDNMVLQRQMPVKIWGKAKPDTIIGIEFLDQKIETKAGKKGNWGIALRPLKTNDIPSVMKIYEDGKVVREISNILVGEVWVAGGQSNMQWSLEQINVLEDELDRGENSMIRMFTQPHDAASVRAMFDSPEGSKWELSSKENFRGFSALSFFFAEELYSKLKVPVAIVQTSFGGSKMVPWLAKEDVEESLVYSNYLAKFNELKENYDYADALLKWKEAKALATAENKPFKKRMPNELSPLSLQSTPSYLYNAKVAPIAGYVARGFLWYQGESDLGEVENFSAKFEALIRSWRKYWGRVMPFYFVQLPSYAKAKENWVQVRWQQYLTQQRMRSVEMVVSLDTGEEDNIHPSDKEIISKRLVKIAQKKLYGSRFMTGEFGPIYETVTYNGNEVVIEFDTFGRILKQHGELRGFEILVDGEWVAPVDYELNPSEPSVTLKAQQAKEIKAVRYLWQAWAKPNISLTNDLDMPAMGFIDEKKEEKATPEEASIFYIGDL